MKRYVIVRARFLEELEKEVNVLMLCGYVPSGGLCQFNADNKNLNGSTLLFAQALYIMEN